MKMLDLKPYGAFIENTIRPMIEEFHILIDELQKNGLNFSKDDLLKSAKFITNRHIIIVVIQSITGVIICGIICLTLLKIYQ